MPVVYNVVEAHDEELTIKLEKSFSATRYLYCHLILDTSTFADYQKDLFQDFLSELVDFLSAEEVTYEQFKKHLEKLLQDLNTKLQVFAEKIKDVEKFSVRGIIQAFFDSEYVASMIGPIGIAIVRDDKLNYMLSNHIQDQGKIDLFSEFVEGEIKEEDQIVAMGIPVDTYLDKDDVETAIHMSQTEDISLAQALMDLLSVRISQEQLGFVVTSLIESGALFSQKKIKKSMSGHVRRMAGWTEKLNPYKHYLIYGGIALVAVVLIYWLIQSFIRANEATFVDEMGGVVIDFTIDDIQKDIALFKKIDPSSNEKIKKYNEIIAQLDLLENSNRWTYDVAELRKILETEYYKGFNIVLVNNDSFFKEPAYQFSAQELNTLGQPYRVFYRNGLMIGGSQGVLLGAINDNVRGTLISAGERELEGCGLNLLKNGLYCFTLDDQLYNVIKSGFEPVTTISSFPSDIVDVSTFQSSNMYLLTNDDAYNAGDTYIVRYTNQLGYQERFGEATQYNLGEGVLTDTPLATSSGFSSFAIDGTFLTRSTAEKKLYQLWRESTANQLLARELPLLGGDTIGDQYSSDVEVIAEATSRYVYLYDRINQTFTVYRSTPYKTNDANTTSYKLAYFFRIKFALPGNDVRDVYVQEGEKSVLYVMTDEAVYTMQLHDFIATFMEQQTE